MEFPLYIESKKESMPNKIHEVNMHAQNFQEPIPKDKEKPSEEKIPNEYNITWRISIKDTSRNEISIGTHKMISNSQKRGWFQTNQALYKVS